MDCREVAYIDVLLPVLIMQLYGRLLGGVARAISTTGGSIANGVSKSLPDWWILTLRLSVLYYGHCDTVFAVMIQICDDCIMSSVDSPFFSFML